MTQAIFKETCYFVSYATAGALLSHLQPHPPSHISSLSTQAVVVLSLVRAVAGRFFTYQMSQGSEENARQAQWVKKNVEQIELSILLIACLSSLLCSHSIRLCDFALDTAILTVQIAAFHTLLLEAFVLSLVFFYTVQEIFAASILDPPPLLPLFFKALSFRWPFREIPLHYPTQKGLFLPMSSFDIQSLPPPDISWEALEKIPDGTSLYQRLLQEPQLAATNATTYYPRLKAYVRHLLTYANKHPQAAEAIFFLFKETEGRCGAIYEDIENAYFLYCHQESASDLDSTLIFLGWKIRQELFAHFIQDYDVHDASKLRKRIASDIGIVPPQESCNLGRDISSIDACLYVDYICCQYAIHLVEVLYKEAKTEPAPFPLKDTRLKSGDGSFVSDQIFEELMLHKKSPPLLAYTCKLALHAMQHQIDSDPKKWEALFFHTHSIEDLKNLTESDLLDLHHSESTVKARRQAIVYPAFRSLLSKKDIFSFLTIRKMLTA